LVSSWKLSKCLSKPEDQAEVTKKDYEYTWKDGNNHNNLYSENEDGSLNLEGRFTHDLVHKLSNKRNTFLGYMGKDTKKSYYSSHRRYIVDKNLKEISNIKTVLKFYDDLSPTQKEIIEKARAEQKETYLLEHNKEYAMEKKKLRMEINIGNIQ
jgi:hypothetical protein